MTDTRRLVITEDGEKTGYITADGQTAYEGDNEYVASVLEHYNGGTTEVYGGDESSNIDILDESFRTSTARTARGEDLFEYVRGRLSPLSSVDLEVIDEG